MIDAFRTLSFIGFVVFTFIGFIFLTLIFTSLAESIQKRNSRAGLILMREIYFSVKRFPDLKSKALRVAVWIALWVLSISGIIGWILWP